MRHSQKPAYLQDLIDKHWDGEKAELFARRNRPGWDCWGDECPEPRTFDLCISRHYLVSLSSGHRCSCYNRHDGHGTLQGACAQCLSLPPRHTTWYSSSVDGFQTSQVWSASRPSTPHSLPSHMTRYGSTVLHPSESSTLPSLRDSHCRLQKDVRHRRTSSVQRALTTVPQSDHVRHSYDSLPENMSTRSSAST